MKLINGFWTEWNNFEVEGVKETCVTLGLKGGIVKSLYFNTMTNGTISLNPASAFVYIYYLKKKLDELNIQMAMQKNGIYITIKEDSQYSFQKLREILMAVFENRQIDEMDFIDAKNRAIKALKEKFKDGLFRTWCYIYEFTEKEKDYSFQKFAHSLELMECKDINLYIETLINPSNAIIMVNGRINEENTAEIKEIIESCKFSMGIEHTDSYLRKNEYNESDCYLLKRAKCTSIGALYFRFPDEEVTPTEKIFLLMYISEILFVSNGVASADAGDASIIYYNMPIRGYEYEITDIWTDENILDAKKRLLDRIIKKMMYPDDFGIYLGECIFAGIDFHKLIELLQVCDTKGVSQAFKVANVKVVNGAVINEGENNNG